MTFVDVGTGELVETADVDIEAIVVTDRHRQNMGDIDGLAASIHKVGLLNPITCRDVDGALHLVAGERRLRACQTLGWSTIAVHVVSNLSDATAHLMAERDENTCRKSMTPVEMKALTDRILEIERPKAKERQGTRTDLQHSDQPVQKLSTGNRAKAAAAKAAGWSRSQYERVERVERAATDQTMPDNVRAIADDALKKLETGEMTPSGADLAVKAAKAGSGKSRADVEQKIATYKQMADEGYTSRQIAAAIGVTVDADFRKRHGLDVPHADAVVGKVRHFDSNRILSEMVYGMEAFASSIDLIDVADIDADQIDQWASSLKESIRSISRFMKELSRDQQ